MKRLLCIFVMVLILGCPLYAEASGNKIRVINVTGSNKYSGYDVDPNTGAKTSAPSAFINSGAFSTNVTYTANYNYSSYSYYAPNFAAAYIGNNKVRVINVTGSNKYSGYDVDINTGAKTAVPSAFINSGAFSTNVTYIANYNYSSYSYYAPNFVMTYIGNNKVRVINVTGSNSYSGYDVDINTGAKTSVPSAFLNSGAFSTGVTYIANYNYSSYSYYAPNFSATYIGNNKVRVINVTGSNKYSGYDVDINTGAKVAAPSAFVGSGAFSTGVTYVANYNYSSYSYYAPNFVMVSLDGDPSITLTSPSAGQTYSAVAGYNTMTFAGTVRDGDVGDTITAYYRVDGTAGSAGTQIGVAVTANGSNQNPFTSNNTLNIGALSLSNGAHTLYVWASDNYGFKSPETAISFTIDKTKPAVNSTYPVNGAIDIDKRPAITVTFSENIYQSTAFTSITLKNSSGTAAAISAAISANKINITPTADLTTSTAYTVTIPASAVRDAVGNTNNAHTFSFTTGEGDFNLDDFGSLQIGGKINFGQDGTNKLFWYYIGDGTFVMTRESYLAMNKTMQFDDNYNGWSTSRLNQWLNGKGAYAGSGFLQNYLNSDSRIAYVGIPSLTEYDLVSKVCQSEDTYGSTGWWLSTPFTYGNLYSQSNYVYQVGVNGNVTYATVTSNLLVRPTFRLKVEVGGTSAVVSGSTDKYTFTVAQNKPFAVAVVGEEFEGAGTVDVNGTLYTVVQAIKDTGFTKLISDPNHNSGNGFSDTGVKVVTVGTKKLYFIVVAEPTPATIGTVNFTE